ncbi:MAG: HD domain-containing protein [Planctomycetota bacterium]|nr:MAG: HD domain-containing protein [Planctomycetota bacterium]
MANDKLRRRIVFEAARLMYSRRETEYYRAKLKAARKVCGGWVKPSQLPSNAEIRDEIQRFVLLYEGADRGKNLRVMRMTALGVMRLLHKFRPRLIGSTLTGHVRRGSDIDIHVFSSSVEAVAGALDVAGQVYEIEHKHVRKHGEVRLYTHLHIQGAFEIELTLYSPEKARMVFRSSITGLPIERASISQLEKLLGNEYPDASPDEAAPPGESIDRFAVYRALLAPLAGVEQRRKYHPEGDALYHSLQVYELARDELPYDEEFLLAALLHDVGKAIDPLDHVRSGLEALDGYITDRTRWLIENHMDAHKILNGTIGVRAERRLREHPDFEELELLSRCDQAGRQRGAAVPDVNEALDQIAELARLYG